LFKIKLTRNTRIPKDACEMAQEAGAKTQAQAPEDERKIQVNGPMALEI